jgi:hypothetical protein
MPRILRIVPAIDRDDSFELHVAIADRPIKTILTTRDEILALLASGDRALAASEARKVNRRGPAK